MKYCELNRMRRLLYWAKVRKEENWFEAKEAYEETSESRHITLGGFCKYLNSLVKKNCC